MKKIVLFLAAVAVTLLSCSKEQDLTTNNPSPASKKVTIKVSHEATSDPQTKTALNSDNSVSWVGGETLKVVYNGGSNETSEAEAGETTHFTFVTGEGDNYLVYPYSIEASFNGTNFTVPVPATQDGTLPMPRLRSRSTMALLTLAPSRTWAVCWKSRSMPMWPNSSSIPTTVLRLWVLQQ